MEFIVLEEELLTRSLNISLSKKENRLQKPNNLSLSNSTVMKGNRFKTSKKLPKLISILKMPQKSIDRNESFESDKRVSFGRVEYGNF